MPLQPGRHILHPKNKMESSRRSSVCTAATQLWLQHFATWSSVCCAKGSLCSSSASGFRQCLLCICRHSATSTVTASSQHMGAGSLQGIGPAVRLCEDMTKTTSLQMPGGAGCGTKLGEWEQYRSNPRSNPPSDPRPHSITRSIQKKSTSYSW